ncbi:hypothetical protein VK792_02120 [Mesobacterium sp. TK19101]|uniref:Uncharacterized protein n=1 Tax=Mesobacterium hydrothermale TaxID=3111907 RepID=A0ABU6HC93_9RHOB|nr:hypothetical protein [Mesobacterium sp. TK19101]MEC3860070.1 hypothetical protein [Mesobacterium sp. TK19101]
MHVKQKNHLLSQDRRILAAMKSLHDNQSAQFDNTLHHALETVRKSVNRQVWLLAAASVVLGLAVAAAVVWIAFASGSVPQGQDTRKADMGYVADTANQSQSRAPSLSPSEVDRIAEALARKIASRETAAGPTQRPEPDGNPASGTGMAELLLAGWSLLVSLAAGITALTLGFLLSLPFTATFLGAWLRTRPGTGKLGSIVRIVAVIGNLVTVVALTPKLTAYFEGAHFWLVPPAAFMVTVASLALTPSRNGYRLAIKLLIAGLLIAGTILLTLYQVPEDSGAKGFAWITAKTSALLLQEGLLRAATATVFLGLTIVANIGLAVYWLNRIAQD